MNNDLLDLARVRAIPAFITQNQRLQDIAACMPEQSRQIVRTAFACRPETRQQTYEQLKKQYAEQREIIHLSDVNERSKRYRALRAVAAIQQTALFA